MSLESHVRNLNEVPVAAARVNPEDIAKGHDELQEAFRLAGRPRGSSGTCRSGGSQRIHISLVRQITDTTHSSMSFTQPASGSRGPLDPTPSSRPSSPQFLLHPQLTRNAILVPSPSSLFSYLREFTSGYETLRDVQLTTTLSYPYTVRSLLDYRDVSAQVRLATCPNYIGLALSSGGHIPVHIPARVGSAYCSYV